MSASTGPTGTSRASATALVLSIVVFGVSACGGAIDRPPREGPDDEEAQLDRGLRRFDPGALEEASGKPRGEEPLALDRDVTRDGPLAREPAAVEAEEQPTETTEEPPVSYAVATEREPQPERDRSVREQVLADDVLDADDLSAVEGSPQPRVSEVGETYPVRGERDAQQEGECACPASPEDEALDVDEIREARALLRYRFPESTAVRVAGGPPEGFEREPGTDEVYGRASVGGFDRDPGGADDR
ncbi:MAG: hypothetical protein M3Y87_02930 [Myxococcota bacterium]|nr:hypothetical protein [Myxococcota bacterium]